MYLLFNTNDAAVLPFSSSRMAALALEYPFAQTFFASVGNSRLAAFETPINGYTFGYYQLQLAEPISTVLKQGCSVLVLLRNGQIIIPGFGRPLTAGQCFLLRPGGQGNLPQLVIEHSSEFYCLFYPETLPAKIALNETGKSLPELQPRFMLVNIARRMENMLDLLNRLLRKKPLQVYSLSDGCLRLLGLYFREAFRQQANDGWLNRKTLQIRELDAFIRLHLSAEHNHLLNISALAKRTGLSQHRFARLFRDTYGSPFGVYLANARLQTALIMLRDTSHSIRNIAFDTGYADFSSFTRAFKKYHGFTPSSVRNRDKQ